MALIVLVTALGLFGGMIAPASAAGGGSGDPITSVTASTSLPKPRVGDMLPVTFTTKGIASPWFVVSYNDQTLAQGPGALSVPLDRVPLGSVLLDISASSQDTGAGATATLRIEKIKIPAHLTHDTSVTWGQKVKVTVRDQRPTALPANGELAVWFSSDVNPTKFPVVNNVAEVPSVRLVAGTDSFFDAQFLGSDTWQTSAKTSQYPIAVAKAPTVTRITAPAGPVVAGRPNTVTWSWNPRDAGTPNPGFMSGSLVAESISTGEQVELANVTGPGKNQVTVDLRTFTKGRTGEWLLSASNVGNATYLGSQSTDVVKIQILPANGTTTTLVPPTSPTTARGAKVPVTATVTANDESAATGSVQFFVDNQLVATEAVANGKATAQISISQPGSHFVEASFVGTGYLDSKSARHTYTVVQASSTTTGPTGGEISLDTPVVVQVQAHGTDLAPTGLVRMRENGVVISQAPLVDGAATFDLTPLGTGDHHVTFAYDGSTGIAGSETTAHLTVTQATPRVTTRLRLLGDPIVDPVDPLQLNVTMTVPGGAAPEGDVELYVDGDKIQTKAAASALVFDGLPADEARTYEVTVKTRGSGSQLPTEQELSYTVAKAETQTTVAAPDRPITSDDSVAVEVAALGSTAPLVDRLNVREAGSPTLVGVVDLTDGVGEFRPPAGLPPGTYDLDFEYPGDSKTQASSHETTVTVRRPTDLTLTIDRPSVVIGSRVTATATVTVKDRGGNPVSGDVALSIGAGSQQVMTLDQGGVATVTLPTDKVASLPVTADFAGSATQAASRVTQPYAVTKADTSISIVVPPNATASDVVPITVAAAGTSRVPSGKVTVTGTGVSKEVTLDPATGTGALALSGLVARSHRLVFAYQGDDNMMTSQVSRTVLVVKVQTSLALTPSESRVVVGGSDRVVLKAEARAGEAAIEGGVTFSGYGDTETVELVDGIAELTLPADEVNAYEVVAQVAEDGFHTAARATSAYEVVRADTEVQVGVPAKATASDVATVTVRSTNSSVVPGGLLHVTGGGLDDDFDLSDGTVEVPLGVLSLGTHELEFRYQGDGSTEQSSRTATVTLVGATQETETVLEFSRQAPVVAGSDTFSVTATVTAGGEVVSRGGLAFYVDEQLLTSRIVRGPVTVALPIDAVGDHDVRVAYTSGGTPYEPSGADAGYTVAKADTEMQVTLPDDPSAADSASVTVRTTNSSLVPTGDVQVSLDGVDKTFTLADGTADVPLAGLEPGSHTLVFGYGGDDRVNGVVSQERAIQVLPTPTSTSIEFSRADPIVGSEDFTATATVMADGETVTEGQVSFFLNGTFLETQELNGPIEVELPTDEVDGYDVTAEFSGTESWAASDATETYWVVLADTEMQIDLPDEPSTADTATITLSAEGTPWVPSGRLEVTSGSFTKKLDLVDGVTHLALADLGVGEHAVEIFYPGDGKANGFRVTRTFEVAQGDVPEKTITELELSRQEPVVGSDELTVTATVTAGDVVLTDGELEFLVDGKSWKSRPVDGPVTVAVPIDQVGQHEVTARYTGGSAHVPSDGSAAYEVVAASTEVLVAVPQRTAAGAAKVRVRATNSSVVPGGQVHVTGEGVDTWLTLDAMGRADWRLWGLEPRGYVLNFAYEGDGTTHPSDADAVVEVIEGLPSELTVEHREKVLTSDKVRIHVDAQDSEVVPTGDVVVTADDGSGFEATVHLVDGAGTLPLDDFARGVHELHFEYPGDDDVRPTWADTWFEVVEPGTIPVGTHTELELGETSAVVRGAPVTATAEITVDDASAPDGRLELWVDFFPVASVAATGEPVTFDLPANLVKKDRKVWAMFRPSDPTELDQSSSPQLRYSVVKADTEVTVDAPDGATAGDTVPVAVESTNSSVVPAGDVVVSGAGVADRTVELDAEGKGELELAGLAAGSYELTFAYQGDESTNVSSAGPVTVRVVRAATSMTLTPADSTAVVDGAEPVTVRATVLDAAEEPVSGDVVFAGVGTGKTVTLENGVAEWTLPADVIGEHTVRADFAGDELTGPAHATALYRVVKADTRVEVEVPSRATVADVATVTVVTPDSSVVPAGDVVVSGAGVADRTVELDAEGKGELELAGLAAGPYLLSFHYEGDGSTNGSSSEPVAVEIVALASNTTLTLTRGGTAVVGGTEAVTATASVLDAEEHPVVDGEVTFTGVGEPKTVTLRNGVAEWSLPADEVDEYTLTASFDGAGDLGGSSASAEYQVVKADTEVTVDAPDGATAGDTLPVAVESTNSSVVPAGDVVVSGAGVAERTVRLGAAGKGELELAGLAAGSYELTFAYQGDESTNVSSAGPVTVVVSGSDEPVATEMSLAIAPDRVVFGGSQAPVATATVLDAAGEPAEGDVVFTVGEGAPVTVDLADGVAELELPADAVGDFSVVAAFAGDGYLGSERSGSYAVVKADTQTTVTAPVGPIGTGESLSVTVGATNSTALPAGLVKVTGEGIEDRTVTLDGEVDGKAVGALSLSGLEPGEHELLVTYQGDGHTHGSSTEPVKVIVRQSSGSGETATSLIVTPQETPYGGPQALATASVSVPEGEIAGGLVAFKVGDWFKLVPVEGGLATLKLDAVKLGAVEVMAYYLGTGSLNSSTSDLVSYTVVKADTATHVVVPEHATAADELAVSVRSTNSSVLPTGRVHVTGEDVDEWLTLEEGQDGLAVAQLSLAGLEPGSYDLAFAYEGDDHTEVSSTTAAVVVESEEPGDPEATHTSLVLSGEGRAVVGGAERVTATATVLDADGAPVAGEVTFSGVGEPASVTLADGVAELVLPAEKVDHYVVTASFEAADDLTGSDDSADYDVTKADTSVSVEVPERPVGTDGALGITVSSTGSTVVPGGVVLVSGEGIEDRTVQLDAHGVGELALGGLEPGEYDLTFAYGGDESTNVSSSQPLKVIVKQTLGSGETTTGLTLTPQQAPYGGAKVLATASVNVPRGEVAGGLVAFEVGHRFKLVPVEGGLATLELDVDEIGSVDVAAHYLGTATLNSSTSESASYTVVKAATETVVTDPPGPVAAGDAVKVAVDASGSDVLPTGRVHVTGDGVDEWLTLESGGAKGDEGTVGVGELTLPDLAPGSHDLRFDYEGDSHTEASHDTVTVIVKSSGGTTETLTTLVVTPGKVPVGAPKVRATATVTAPGGQSATGLVAFQFGEWYQLVELAGGSAGVDLSTVQIGTVPVRAYYLGAGDLKSSQSEVVRYEVAKAVTSIVVDGAAGELVPGTTLPVRVSAAGSAVVPGGQISVREGDKVLPALEIQGGRATLSLAGLANGTHTLDLAYAGDQYTDASSLRLTVVIKPLATTTSFVLDRASTTANGAAVTATAQVKVTRGSVPTGSLRFEVDGVVVATRSSGVTPVKVALPIAKVGSHKVLVRYLGSATQAASAAPARTYAVTKAPAKVSAKIKKMKGRRLKVTATLTASSPITGKVKVMAAQGKKGKLKAVGKAVVKKAGTRVRLVLRTKALPRGKRSLTIRYLGSASVLSASRTYTVRVR